MSDIEIGIIDFKGKGKRGQFKKYKWLLEESNGERRIETKTKNQKGDLAC